MSKLEDGTIIIKPGKFIPDSEKWLYNQNTIEQLNKAVQWGEATKRHENFNVISNIIEND